MTPVRPRGGMMGPIQHQVAGFSCTSRKLGCWNGAGARPQREVTMSGKSIIKAFLIGLLALGGALATTPSILAQDAPPATEEAKAIENLVNRAATLIDKDGKAAFVEFRKKDSVWFHGDTYLFAYDMGANVLLNPAFPQREGTNVSGQKDSKGKLLHQAIIDTAKKG